MEDCTADKMIQIFNICYDNGLPSRIALSPSNKVANMTVKHSRTNAYKCTPSQSVMRVNIQHVTHKNSVWERTGPHWSSCGNTHFIHSRACHPLSLALSSARNSCFIGNIHRGFPCFPVFQACWTVCPFVRICRSLLLFFAQCHHHSRRSSTSSAWRWRRIHGPSQKTCVQRKSLDFPYVTRKWGLLWLSRGVRPNESAHWVIGCFVIAVSNPCKAASLNFKNVLFEWFQ